MNQTIRFQYTQPQWYFIFVILLLTFKTTFAQVPITKAPAQPDYFQVLTCYPSKTLDVFSNDFMIPCTRPQIVLYISSGSKIGATTSIDGNKNIVYTYPPGFTGRDTLEYTVVCNSVVYTANVFITVVACPDNIAIVDCFGEPVGFAWDIKEDWRSTQTDVSTYISPMVADLNGDGIPEILVGRFNRDVGAFRIYDGVYIYWGHNRNNPTFTPTVEGLFTNYGFSIAKVKIGNVVKPIIVMIGHADGYLYAYDPTKTTEPAARIWKSSHPLDDGFNYTFQDRYTIGFVDFTGKGDVDVYARGRIYNASTGTLLVQVPSGGNIGYSYSTGYPANMYKAYNPIAADVNNDGKAEYIAGTQVYSVNIVNRNGTTGNSMQLIASIPPVDLGGGQFAKDGATVVADINRDGRLDVVVRSMRDAAPFRYGIFAWDVQTQSLIAKSDWITANDFVGYPLIGNIDNEPNLEILLTTNTSSSVGRIDGFRWNGNQTFFRVYTYNTTDKSGCTGITLFDFNQDDVMELVYRDETLLRIMQANQVTGTFTNLRTFSATSGTGYEYPVVADVDNDGSAEIVVVGGTTSEAKQGSLRIYKSGNQFTWAPARKVWNQYAYNVVNVNEDLTIPRFQMNPATIFPSGKQPFNNFLQQQTLLNTNGDLFWPMAKIVFAETPVVTATCDSIVFTGCITNVGDVALQSPIYVTFYKNSTIQSNIIVIDSIKKNLKVDSTLCFKFTIKNIDNYAPFTSIWISINDRNGIYPYQAQCEVDGRHEFIVTTCNYSAEFFANNIHHLELPNNTICNKTGTVYFRAEIEGLSQEAGSLKWFIDYGNGFVEEPDGRDQTVWNKNFQTGTYPIYMWVRYSNGDIVMIPSKLKVEIFFIKIQNVRH